MLLFIRAAVPLPVDMSAADSRSFASIATSSYPYFEQTRRSPLSRLYSKERTSTRLPP